MKARTGCRTSKTKYKDVNETDELLETVVREEAEYLTQDHLERAEGDGVELEKAELDVKTP